MDLDRFSRVVKRVRPQARLVKAWPLAGGVSSWVVALALEEETIVFRRHGQADRELNPNIARDEHRLLGMLRAGGLPVPESLLLDESGEVFPEPYIVTEFVEGEPGCPDLEKMATTLAQIHALEGDFSFLPKRLPEPPQTTNAPALLHGDFWPGNILWKDGEISGVIDWEDAAIGDPLSDLATTRLELAWAVEMQAGNEFTQHYLAKRQIDAANLPWWDWAMAIRATDNMGSWGLDSAKEAEMREKTIAFGRHAIQQLLSGF